VSDEGLICRAFTAQKWKGKNLIKKKTGKGFE
jgi:hypothetical protein